MIDVFKDPYGRKHYAHKKRITFNKLKTTPEFLVWRTRQVKIQRNRCAYCRIKLSIEGIVTHVDHVQPLYYEGSNDFTNLLLACRRCNTRKWINDRYVVPEWIKRNEAHYEQYLLKQAILTEIDQEHIAARLRWIT